MYRGIIRKVRKLSLKTTSWRASEMREFMRGMTGHEFDPSYVRRMMRKWGFTQKVPVLEHINRAAKRTICRFQKSICKTVKIAKEQGYTACMQDESIVVAEARPGAAYTHPAPQEGSLHV